MAPIPIPPELPQQAAHTTAEHPWPLRLLSAKMKEYIDRMSHIWVQGEVIQYAARPRAKTQFLTLKDEEQDVSMNVAIMTYLVPPTLSPGDTVVVYCKPNFWDKRGSLSLWAQEIRPVGAGDILARIEALKNRLATEGLFDERHKKPLPFIPRRIGLIAGRNAEGTRDVLVNTRRRFPAADFEVREVAVQGAQAVAEILPALAELDAMESIDVIVIARGGGSLEDLLPFSDERLVRAVFAAETPVVSAIGHERDTPLLDFVADLRASTPTDAARRIVPDLAQELEELGRLRDRMRSAAERTATRLQSELDALRSRPALARPSSLVDARQEDLASLKSWLRSHMRHFLNANEAKVARHIVTLRTLSPLSTLERGYSILMDSSGVIVSSTSQTHAGDKLEAVLADGRLGLSVTGRTQGNNDAH